MEARVRAGVTAAATDEEVRDMLAGWADAIEERVRPGVTDAVANLANPDGIREATLNVTEVGTNLITEGLNTLLGGARREPEERE